uniref:Major facilitator superfamily (MFS) profile domain-containing protein n=1 Tax=Timema bartmani TaxID=61472 RepID=A0A7R9EYK7_9NEOP|nr:unnamed protein product [Timema bartmani]
MEKSGSSSSSEFEEEESVKLFEKTILRTSDWYRSPISDPRSPHHQQSIVYCESGALVHLSTEAGDTSSHWNLVCDRHQLANVAQTVFMFGVLMGNALFGMAADRFGRKKPLVLAILLQSLAGVTSAFVPWFEVFLILRFIDAMATGGTMITSFVLCMELVGGWWRLVFSMISHIPFSLGHSLMAAIAYYARDWRTFQLAVSLPSIVLLSYWCYYEGIVPSNWPCLYRPSCLCPTGGELLRGYITFQLAVSLPSFMLLSYWWVYYLPTGRISTVPRAVVLLVVSYYESIVPSNWPCLYRSSCCCPIGGELLRGYITFQLALYLSSIVLLSYWCYYEDIVPSNWPCFYRPSCFCPIGAELLRGYITFQLAVSLPSIVLLSYWCCYEGILPSNWPYLYRPSCCCLTGGELLREYSTFQLALSLPFIVLLSYWCYYEDIVPSNWPCFYRPSCFCPIGAELLRGYITFQLAVSLPSIVLLSYWCYYKGIGYSTFQLAVSLPSIVLLSYWWTIPESPRWLLTAGRETEAIAILERAAKVNKRDVAQVVPAVKSFINKKEKRDSQDTNKKANILDLFRTPNLRLTTLCLYFNWLVCGFCFYGLAQYMGHLGGNIFVNIAVSGLIEMPGCVVCIYFMGKFGRRNTMISSQMLAATACLLIAVVPQGEGKPEWPKVMLAGLGIVGMSFSFPTVYLYSGELFPTVVRNIGVGSASMCARIGSMVAPFVSSLNHFSYYIPPLLFGLSPLAAALLTFLLPETANRDLPDTLEEGENFRLVLLWIHTFAETQAQNRDEGT